MKVLNLTEMPILEKKSTYLYFRMKNGELSIILHMYNKIGLQFLLVNMIEHVMVVIMQNCTDYDSVNMLMICKVITSNNIIN